MSAGGPPAAPCGAHALTRAGAWSAPLLAALLLGGCQWIAGFSSASGEALDPAHDGSADAGGDGSADAGGDGGADAGGDGSADAGGDSAEGGVTCKLPAVAPNCTDGWCTIPAGCFTMGASPGDVCADTNETPHQVTLTHGFIISETEVTIDAVQGTVGPGLGDYESCNKTDCPQPLVTWHQAAYYCNRLSSIHVLEQCYACDGDWPNVDCEEATQPYACTGFRLPTEAEWEYAYRAGATAAYHNGPNSSDPADCDKVDLALNPIAWYSANSAGGPHPVAGKSKNGWGLRDMAGNVNEWVHDLYQADLGTAPATDPLGAAADEQRVIRGGCWAHGPERARASWRMALLPGAFGVSVGGIGFRCVRLLD